MDGISDWLSRNSHTVRDLTLAVTAFVGAVVAVLGLRTWRKQLSGTVEYELARRLLRATYQFREAIEVVRSPFMSTGEMPEPPVDNPASSTTERKIWYGRSKAYENRWAGINRARSEINTELLEAETIWGPEIKSKFTRLWKIDADLYYQVLTLLDESNPDIKTDKISADERKKRRDILYARSDKTKDVFYQSLQEAIDEIEKELRPHLKRYS